MRIAAGLLVAVVVCSLGFAGAMAKQAPFAGSVIQDCRDCPEMVVNLYDYPAWPLDGKPVEVYSACPNRVTRGGSWTTKADRLRLTWRGRDKESVTSRVFGFRIARDLS